MKKIETKEILIELDKLHKESPNGLLSAENVVKCAEDPASPLHKAFEWDDNKASHQFRLWQARVLITKFKVKLVGGGEEIIPIRLSLIEDRQEVGGGYRYTEDILESEELTEELMRTAVKEIEAWMKRYSMLKDLVESVGKSIKPFQRFESAIRDAKEML